MISNFREISANILQKLQNLAPRRRVWRGGPLKRRAPDTSAGLRWYFLYSCTSVTRKMHFSLRRFIFRCEHVFLSTFLEIYAMIHLPKFGGLVSKAILQVFTSIYFKLLHFSNLHDSSTFPKFFPFGFQLLHRSTLKNFASSRFTEQHFL